MRVAGSKGIYEDLGVRRVINAVGSMTLLGGSTLSSGVLAAMAEANDSFVDMAELLDRSGRAIAEMLGAEAALVTSGCFAALAQGAAAIMAGGDADKIRRLPDTTGMRNEFLIQKATRYHYDRAPTVAGGRLVEFGGAQGARSAQLETAVGPRTAGILYPARFEGTEGVLPLADVVAVAKTKGIAVLVDAAAEVYPVDRMRRIAARSGADAVGFGAKYLGSGNSTGFLVGRRDVVAAAALNGFIAYETHDNQAFGRGFKLDRQEIVATVVAVREWLAADHEAHLAEQARRIETIAGALAGLAGVGTERVRLGGGPWWQLRVMLGRGRPTAMEIERALREGEPSVRVRLDGESLLVYAHNLKPGEETVVADRLRQVLSA
jgi:L-seryl-tRNA(Ser) seleniumtransferase